MHTHTQTHAGLWFNSQQKARLRPLLHRPLRRCSLFGFSWSCQENWHKLFLCITLATIPEWHSSLLYLFFSAGGYVGRWCFYLLFFVDSSLLIVYTGGPLRILWPWGLSEGRGHGWKVRLVLEASRLKWCLESAYPMNHSNQRVSLWLAV